MSQLYYAVLTGRALQLASVANLPDWAVAFDSPHINWTAPPFPDAVLEPLLLPYNQSSGTLGAHNYSASSGVDTARYWPINHFSRVPLDPTIDEFFWDTDLTTQPEGHADVPYVMFASNRGRTYRLWENRYHRTVLRQWGMRASDAFRCGFHFLLRPNQATQAAMAAMAARMSQTETLKIGIHIRVGDGVFKGGAKDPSLQDYQHFFDCAQQIEDERRAPKESVIWYLISDSPALRRQALEKWPRKVLTDTDAEPVHVDCQRFPQRGCGSIDAAFRTAVAELMTFSSADYHVVTHDSGFGMLGAWLSEGERHIYSVRRGVHRNCGRWNYDPLDKMATTWAGI
ncbi:Proteophosphoglycan ppg4 [Micractinium conductrix]|uniref:Proteophosphoglycan ppg4 n=1 Tax=Micractinium conductrix TaxID=554055 RepID=A0A2P6V7E5_9CHLO|nr:Proteophosphoglycan ppg4 [Micractinium conductrix]PSC70131.1 Proteophosphoglycan ppg4 [Micractinium conductrix]|eukprot:PSC70003.1 Proteophosphoglycan ppg4 [Micractinium conductrix]